MLEDERWKRLRRIRVPKCACRIASKYEKLFVTLVSTAASDHRFAGFSEGSLKIKMNELKELQKNGALPGFPELAIERDYVEYSFWVAAKTWPPSR